MNNTKKYIVDGKKMQFDSNSFGSLFNKRCKTLGKTKTDYEIELGEVLNVTSGAIHNWRFGQNGPIDIETIKQLANYLEISDFRIMLKEVKENNNMQITERQKDSLKRIYEAIIEYLDHFIMTDGFNDYWHKLCNKGVKPENVEERLYEIAESAQHKVELVLDKEYIELYRLPAYNELKEYVIDDLCEIYNGKLSYAYRFEAGVENIDGTRTTRTTEEDYTYALKKINEIMEKLM